MSKSRQVLTEENFITFIAENMDEFKPEMSETEATASIDADEDYSEDYVSEDGIARENGFWVDEDGHWRELDEDGLDW